MGPIRFILVHSGPFWFILVHSGAFWFILVHSVSFCFILVHSGSFRLILFWFIPVHSGSFCFNSGLFWYPVQSWFQFGCCGLFQFSSFFAPPRNELVASHPVTWAMHRSNNVQCAVIVINDPGNGFNHYNGLLCL